MKTLIKSGVCGIAAFLLSISFSTVVNADSDSLSELSQNQEVIVLNDTDLGAIRAKSGALVIQTDPIINVIDLVVSIAYQTPQVEQDSLDGKTAAQALTVVYSDTVVLIPHPRKEFMANTFAPLMSEFHSN